MKLFRVSDTEDDTTLWVAALGGEHLYCYVQNTGRFHDNNALRNDYYMERELSYQPIGVAEARELIADGVGLADEQQMERALARWRGDPGALAPEDVFTAVLAVVDD
jgi:hypothetical protein